MAGVMCESAVKKPRLDPSDFYDEDSSLTSCSDESRYSYQGYETAWVKDSGDDWSPSSSSPNSCSDSDGDATDVIYEVQYEEYEIASDSSTSQEGNETADDSSSDAQDIILPLIAAAALDDECLAGSESESSDDYIIRTSPPPPPGLPEDRWKCRSCGIQNHPPMSYCHSCWTRRKDWLGPPRSRKRKRRQGQGARKDLSSQSAAGDSQGPGPSSQEASAYSSSSGFSSSQGSLTIEDGPSSQPSASSSSSSELCGACGIRRPNGAFMHGKTGHMIYCYPCSKQIWQGRKQSKCPVCRRTIEKVAKMFLATSSA